MRNLEANRFGWLTNPLAHSIWLAGSFAYEPAAIEVETFRDVVCRVALSADKGFVPRLGDSFSNNCL